MKHRVRLTNIVWDTDGFVEPIASDMTVEVDTEAETDDELFAEAIDEATNQTGFCIVSADARRTFLVVKN